MVFLAVLRNPPQLHPELAPRHGEVGVVVGGLAQEADGVHRHQRLRPAVGVVLAADPAVLQVPLGEAVFDQFGRDVGVGVGAVGHGVWHSGGRRPLGRSTAHR